MRYLFFLVGLGLIAASLAAPFLLPNPYIWGAPILTLLGAIIGWASKRTINKHNRIQRRKAMTKRTGENEKVLPPRKILPKKKSRLE